MKNRVKKKKFNYRWDLFFKHAHGGKLGSSYIYDGNKVCAQGAFLTTKEKENHLGMLGLDTYTYDIVKTEAGLIGYDLGRLMSVHDDIGKSNEEEMGWLIGLAEILREESNCTTT